MARKSEQLPAEDTVEEVAPGILRLQLPANFTGLGHVNMYVLEDERGIAVVDPGLPGKGPWGWIPKRLALAGFKVTDVHTIVVTHSHPDHYGGAGRLAEETNADIVASAQFHFAHEHEPDLTVLAALGDADAAEHEERVERAPHRDLGAEALAAGRRSRRWRHPEWGKRTPWGTHSRKPELGYRTKMRVGRIVQPSWYVLPVPNVSLADGAVVRLAGREWFAVHTPGHTTDHLCLWDPEERVMISGDHVLPSITPHVGGQSGMPNPLDDFLSSLDRVGEYDAQVVLPAHGVPFHDLAGRSKDIREHHERRLAQIAEISVALGPATVEEFSHELFAKRHWGMMADSETFAHLEHLRLAGRAEAHLDKGRIVYTVAG